MSTFEKPRVFEKNKSRVTVHRDDLGIIPDILGDGWREVTSEPFDITKLDTAGVFHEVPKKRPDRSPGQVAYDEYARFVSAVPWSWLDQSFRQSWERIAEVRNAEANATIAELRARVAELEAPTFDQSARDEMLLGMYERELRDQMTKAWMRNDLATADRIADLIGERRPSEHEAADSKAEVQA